MDIPPSLSFFLFPTILFFNLVSEPLSVVFDRFRWYNPIMRAILCLPHIFSFWFRTMVIPFQSSIFTYSLRSGKNIMVTGNFRFSVTTSVRWASLVIYCGWCFPTITPFLGEWYFPPLPTCFNKTLVSLFGDLLWLIFPTISSFIGEWFLHPCPIVWTRSWSLWWFIVVDCFPQYHPFIGGWYFHLSPFDWTVFSIVTLSSSWTFHQISVYQLEGECWKWEREDR